MTYDEAPRSKIAMMQRLRWPFTIFVVCVASGVLIAANYAHIESERVAYSEHVALALRFCDMGHFSGILRETRALEEIARTPAEVAYAQELRRKFRLHECELPVRPTLSVEEAGLP